MATVSTASSGTEGPDPQDPEEAAGSADSPGAPDAPASPDAETSPSASSERGHDASRRAFFLQFGRQAVSAAGQVAGMADLVGRTSGGGISELLGLDEPSAAAERPAFARSEGAPVSSAPPIADDAFRSPYRLSDDGLVLLDQRGIPERLEEVLARRGSDVAYYLRLGVARGGPLLAQVAAYGLALTAEERADQPAEQRDVELRRTVRALVEARPSSRLLGWSLARMQAAIGGFAASSPGADVATALRAEADAIADDISTAHAAMAATLYELLEPPHERPLGVVLHGHQGTLAGGVVGTAVPALRRRLEVGADLRVFVPEGRPFMDGARLASWELRQAGIEHRVVPDAAVAWLLEREPIDVILVNAEWTAANGDVGALIGARALALLAAGTDARLIVSGLEATRDQGTPDGSAIPVELRPAGDQVAYLADTPIRASDALVPATDVIPAATIEAMVSEVGVSRTEVGV